MCGIIGYIGKKIKIERLLVDSLKTLEYRGYDSAGIAFVTDKVNILKSSGKIINLEEKIDDNVESNIGLAHTRWATHGKADDINAHPHKSGSVTIVHNGIIENYLELKEMLSKEGYTFKSETDTEIAAALLDYLKKKGIWSNLEVIKEFETYIKGSYALGIIFDDELDTLYAARKDSPLILGIGKEEYLIASDVSAIIEFTKKYILLDNEEIVKMTNDNYEIYNSDLQKLDKSIQEVNWDVEEAHKAGYPHFMLKEIMEEPKVLNDTIHEYVESVDSFMNKMPDFSKYKKIHIVACGSAMHAGLIGKYLIENYSDIEVNVEIASEYRYKKVFYDKETLLILISQSGETADTIAAMRKANDNNVDTLAIVNVESSTIERECTYSVLIEAGKEIAVATTKAFILQVLILSLLSYKLNPDDKYKEDIKSIPQQLKVLLDKTGFYKKLADSIYKHDDVFFMGRKIDYAISMEGSLKLKEVSYIHSDSYQAGELKHGTISLVNEGTIVFAIVTDDEIRDKTISNLEEVISRGAKPIYVGNVDVSYENKIVIPRVHKKLQPLLAVPPLQMIAYFVALKRGCDIDKPKNLAKSVTVE